MCALRCKSQGSCETNEPCVVTHLYFWIYQNLSYSVVEKQFGNLSVGH